jgi:uracil-DNA glycosylase
MKCAIVGEAYGETEEQLGVPFAGSAGGELTKQLLEAGLKRPDFFITNVFNFRPRDNKLQSICLDKVAAIKALADCKLRLPNLPWPAKYDFQPLAGPGNYLDPQYLPELWRLKEELSSRQIDLAIALGNTACWGLLGHTGIGRLRGFEHESILVPGLRVIPTYHPASIFRNFSNRPIAIADLQKARKIITGEFTSRIQRDFWIEPTLADIREWRERYLSNGEPFAADVETRNKQVTCIGFGVPTSAICIPFWDKRKPGWNYWPTPQDEVLALQEVQRFFDLPGATIYQNGGYDLQYVWRPLGLRPSKHYEDTMLIHHALQPEMQKDLSFLASNYTDVPSWKELRKKAKLTIHSDKRED